MATPSPVFGVDPPTPPRSSCPRWWISTTIIGYAMKYDEELLVALAPQQQRRAFLPRGRRPPPSHDCQTGLRAPGQRSSRRPASRSVHSSREGPGSVSCTTSPATHVGDEVIAQGVDSHRRRWMHPSVAAWISGQPPFVLGLIPLHTTYSQLLELIPAEVRTPAHDPMTRSATARGSPSCPGRSQDTAAPLY